ncbi:MAG: hypothetical protein IKU52_06805 [Clostridia bacterium]|nr:hypothetical protein [Clostridia bacterium]
MEYRISSFDDLLPKIKFLLGAKDHPNILKLTDVKKDGKYEDFYITTEDMLSLKKHLKNSTPDLLTVIKLGIDISCALELYHSGNFSCNNLCIENIFVSNNQTFKLGEFEMFSPDGTDIRDNIYSLGVIMYSLVNDYNLLPEDSNSELKEQLLEIFDHSCNSDIKKRYLTPTEFKNDLLKYKAALILSTTADQKDQPNIKSAKKSKFPIILITLFIVAALLISSIAVIAFFIARSMNKESQSVYAHTNIGDEILFGSYEQNIKNEELEDIEWIVLEKDSDSMLLISKYALECSRFDSERKSDWESSELRNFLNREFLDTAFSEEELLSLCNINGDKVSLLSKDKIKEYFPENSDRILIPTDYAKEQGIWVNKDYDSCFWWLISNKKALVPNISSTGKIDTVGCDANTDNAGVRPVISIKIN